MVQIDGFDEKRWGVFPPLDEVEVFNAFVQGESKVVLVSREKNESHEIVIEITMTSFIASVDDEALVKSVRLGANEENSTCMDLLEYKSGFIPPEGGNFKGGQWLIFNYAAIDANQAG